MALRLLQLRIPRVLSCRRLMALQESQSRHPQLGLCAVAIKQIKCLHVKTSDQEAGYDEQRGTAQGSDKKIGLLDGASVKIAPSISRRVRIRESAVDASGSQNLFKPDDALAIKTAATENQSEIENLMKAENADLFGSGHPNNLDEREADEGDLAEEQFLENPPSRSNRLKPVQYARLIKDCFRNKDIKGAIEVLERRMLKEDRVRPETYTYNLLISGCAKFGYTRKAFKLFSAMQKRRLRVTGGTYTSLFNACANAPSPDDGLKKANYVRELMLEKGVEPNTINYNAMIKAYGRCNDVKTAYQLADEMMEKKLALTRETFNFLLQACASDRDFGFRHALLTWHKMLQRGIKPDYYSFHTMLRCVRDGEMGDIETMQQVLKTILSERQGINQMLLDDGSASSLKSEKDLVMLPTATRDQEQKEKANILELNSSEYEAKYEVSGIRDASPTTEVVLLPNLLAPLPVLGSLVSIAEVTKPHERFLLIGGLNGFLDLMKSYNITPDIQMFTSILEVLPPTRASEKQVLSFIRRIGLKADIDFFNVLIKKRSMRFDYDGAKEVVNMIHTAKLQPDIVTYGVLALSCQTEEQAQELLQEMRSNGIRLNIQVLGAMLRQGCANTNFPYVNAILQISLDENIKPNDMFLQHLHKFYNQCARAIDARHRSTKTNSFKNGHKKFCAKLRLYYEEQGLSGLKLQDAIKKIQERPYEHYKEEPVEGMEPVKNQKLSQKQKTRKYLKKIKLQHLQDDGDDSESRSKNLLIDGRANEVNQEQTRATESSNERN